MTTLSKMLLPFLLSFFVFQNGNAQTRQQTVPTKIEKVTVFLTGGQITRTATASIPTGKTELVFKDISPNIDKQSIQVKGDGAFTILSVVHQLNHLQEQVQREEITQLEAEKNRLSEEKKVQTAMLSVFKQEETMLQKNQSIGGTNTGVTTSELQQAVDFQRKRMTEVLMKQLETSKSLARLDSILLKLDKQLIALNQKKDLATSEILVNVSAKSPVSAAKFEISYFVKDAGWFANYDLRVKDVSSPIDLAFKANVRQGSGEDWKDVKLTLSNGDPTVSGVAQELEPWRLRFGFPPPVVYKGGLGIGGIREVKGIIMDRATGEPLIGATVLLKGSSIGTITDIGGSYSIKIPPAPATLEISYTGYTTQEVPVNSFNQNIALEVAMSLQEVVVTGLATQGRLSGADISKRKQSRSDKTIPLQNQEVYRPTTVNFEIEMPYTILNDGKTYTVDIKAETVPASYEYFATPKLDENAYLTAHVTDWQDLNLLDGEVNLFFEGAYLGKSLLDTRSAGDTLDISLGQDKGILVKRTRLKDFSSRQFIGSNKTERRAFEILVKNNKLQPVSITIQDQFPVSTDKSISVDDLKYDGAELDKETQILTWKLNLAPREERKLEMRYSVKYPKREVLILE